jgi:hypothetical protein
MAVGDPFHAIRSELKSLTPHKMGLSGKCGPISHSWLPWTFLSRYKETSHATTPCAGRGRFRRLRPQVPRPHKAQ